MHTADVSSARPRKASLLNAAVILAALVLFGGAVATLVQPAGASSQAEPKVLVRLGAIERAAGGHVVEFEAVNTGDAGASRVFLKGMLKRGDEVVETSSASLGVLPAGSTQPGGLYFRQDPVGYDVQVEAEPLISG